MRKLFFHDRHLDTRQRIFEAIVHQGAPVSLEHVRAVLELHQLREAVRRAA